MKFAKIFLLATLSLTLVSCAKEKEEYEGTDPSTILNGYYKDLESWDNYIDLRQKLYKIIYKDFVAIPYTETPLEDGTIVSGTNWDTNRNADQSIYNYDKVHLLYNDNEADKYLGNSTDWQREHCFPASLMTGESTGDAVKTIGTATDFHNLYASFSTANGIHSNNCYGYVDPSNDIPVKTTGNAKYQEEDRTRSINAIFEPADIDKGRVARAVFYIGLMYGSDKWVNTKDNAGHTLSTGIEVVKRSSKINCTLQSAAQGVKCHSNSEDLVDWARKFWPDRLEYQHTTYVQKMQHNRNPFVDFPELVEYVYGDKQMESGELSKLHNIYDILDLGNNKVNNIAIKNVRHSYDAGDVYDSTKDIEVYEVKNDLRSDRIDDYTIKGINDGSVLTNAANGKYITVSKGDAKSVNYPIYVASNAWKQVDYVGLPTSELVKQKYSKETESAVDIAELNGVTWSFTSSAHSTSTLEERRKDIGVTIGSSSSPCDTLIIETSSDMAYDEKSVVNGVFIEANTISKWNGSFHVQIELAGDVIYEYDASYNSYSPLQSFGVSLSNLNKRAGKIRITISNIQVGINIGRLGASFAE